MTGRHSFNHGFAYKNVIGNYVQEIKYCEYCGIVDDRKKKCKK